MKQSEPQAKSDKSKSNKSKSDKVKLNKKFLEKSVLDTFAKPIVLWTYDDDVLVKKKLLMMQYDLRVDGKLYKKLEVMFAFARRDYDSIRSGIRINKQVKSEGHTSIVKRSERPIVVKPGTYRSGTRKDVKITLRTGHVLIGHQVDVNDYNILLRINDKPVLVYKHGILDYEIQSTK